MTDGVKSRNFYFLSGFFLITLIALMLLLTSTLFLLGVSISGWIFPASVLLTAGITYKANNSLFGKSNLFVKTSISCLAIIVLSIAVSGFFYDVSYDGQSYHQEAIIQMREGWKPPKESLPSSVNEAIFVNHYPKGVEAAQSAIYSTTNKIETGKATNFLVLSATFFLTLYLLLGYQKLAGWKAWLISIILVFNPISINQLLTFLTDGHLACMILCLFVCSVIAIKNPNFYNLTLLAFVIIVLVNIKFTSLVYAVFFLTMLLGWLVLGKQWILFKTIAATAICGGFLGVFLVGFNPYVKNISQNGHPFYPVMGPEKVDIISFNLPKGFEHKSRAEKFFLSYFSHTDNVMPDNGKTVKPKLPFAFNTHDIINTSKPDIRIAGFGPFFSGVLIFSLAALIYILIKSEDKPLKKDLVYVSLVIIISICIMPESWWTRYIPQFWLLPGIILLATELSGIRNQFVNLSKAVTYVFLLLTIAFTGIGFGWNFMTTALINYQLKKLQTAKEPVPFQFVSAKSNRVRLKEHGIKYTEKNLDGQKVEDVIHSNSKFKLVVMDSIPKSSLIVWAEKFRE